MIVPLFFSLYFILKQSPPSIEYRICLQTFRSTPEHRQLAFQIPLLLKGHWIMFFLKIISSAQLFSFVASTLYLIAASSISMFISFSVLNLMQYPLTLALPSFFPYVCDRYFLSLRPRI